MFRRPKPTRYEYTDGRTLVVVDRLERVADQMEQLATEMEMRLRLRAASNTRHALEDEDDAGS
jgi:hypothetical protein